MLRLLRVLGWSVDLVSPYIHAYIHTYIHSFFHSFIPTHLHTYVYININIYIYIYIYMFIRISGWIGQLTVEPFLRHLSVKARGCALRDHWFCLNQGRFEKRDGTRTCSVSVPFLGAMLFVNQIFRREGRPWRVLRSRPHFVIVWDPS